MSKLKVFIMNLSLIITTEPSWPEEKRIEVRICNDKGECKTQVTVLPMGLLSAKEVQSYWINSIEEMFNKEIESYIKNHLV